jgi:hypothetical protein
VLVGSECQDVSTEPWEDGPQRDSTGISDERRHGLDATENHLADPGFEEGLLTSRGIPPPRRPGGRRPDRREWLRTGAGLEAGDAHGGEAGRGARGAATGSTNPSRALLTFDDRYVVRAWRRADTPTDAESSSRSSAAGSTVLPTTGAPITAWPDWRVHSVGMQGPEDLQRVAASIRGAAGAAWFDDVRLEVASADPLTFDLAGGDALVRRLRAQVAPSETAFVGAPLEALGIRFVRVSVTGAKDADLVATEAGRARRHGCSRRPTLSETSTASRSPG